MKRRLLPIVAAPALMAAAPGLVSGADRWCATNAPGAVFCDDFDRYCVNPPPSPEACPSGSSGNSDPFWQLWNFSFMPCALLTLGDAFYDSPPYAARTPNQDGAQTTHTGASLSPYIRAKFGNEYPSMMGTDLAPMVVEYSFHGQSGGRINAANSFMEVALGASQAPVDYILSPNCSGCGGENRRYEIICQQQNAPAGCPPLAAAPHWASLAVGAVALLDTDPCECGGGMHSPWTPRLSYFDGYQWWQLRAGLFPGGGSGGPTPGDFLLRPNINRIRLTIRSTSVKVELTCLDPNPDEYSWCEVPRDYLGPFSHVYLGFRAPCRLKTTGVWECAENYDCVKGVPGGGVPTYDNIAVKGGLGYGAPGACCLPDKSCITTQGPLDCQQQGGINFAGAGTVCGNVACCPALRADHDVDGDVDVSDFGWLQLCMPETGNAPPNLPCTCADLNNDTRVDANDVTTFINCLSGPDVPANPNCVN